MAEYSILVSRSARKELEGLDAPHVRRIIAKNEKLPDNPPPAGCIKLVGEFDLWRIRVGDYQMVYSIQDANHLVDIIAFRHRKDAYRR
ncbi:MAG: hypothetical protein FLDDKLPJ_01172 [Phycisphaerae bacterium]|nr:hypothetical protein [Phycisphaerae bacterium]